MNSVAIAVTATTTTTTVVVVAVAVVCFFNRVYVTQTNKHTVLQNSLTQPDHTANGVCVHSI